MTDKGSAPNWQRLQLADFGSTAEGARPGLVATQKKPQVAAKHENEKSQGYLEGYNEGLSAGRAEGLAAGEAAGAAEGQQAADQLLQLSTKLDLALTMFDHELAEEVLALSLEIARQMLRQTIAAKPETVLPVVEDALSQLPHLHAVIYLHPEDASLVRKHSGEQLSHAGHRIHEDARLQRGDAVIESSGAQVDATLAGRWRRIMESLGSKTPWIDEERRNETR